MYEFNETGIPDRPGALQFDLNTCQANCM